MNFNNWLCNIMIIIIVSTKLQETFSNELTNSNIEIEYITLTNNKSSNSSKYSKSGNHQEELEKINKIPESLKKLTHLRKKRFIWITDDGRLALPPGTTLSISPSISLPFVRHPPEGFLSNLSVNFPVSIDFDKLGLTDDQNPLGDLPPIFARSFGETAGSMLSSYIADYVRFRRAKRDVSNYQTYNSKFKDEKSEPSLPNQYKNAFHGGERVLLYGVVEDFLETFGIDGKSCILRAICEIHSKELNHFGLFGEITKLFLTASQSPFSQHIKEYVEAEEIGKGNLSPGECFPYYKNCPKSMFKPSKNNYSKQNLIQNESEFNENIVESASNKMVSMRK